MNTEMKKQLEHGFTQVEIGKAGCIATQTDLVERVGGETHEKYLWVISINGNELGEVFWNGEGELEFHTLTSIDGFLNAYILRQIVDFMETLEEVKIAQYKTKTAV